MKQFPPIPPVETAPDRLLESGHLWLLEKIDGGHLRFQLRESGLLRFGDRRTVYDDPDDLPARYRHAVRHVRERFDRDAFRRAADDVEAVVFFGEAMHHQAIDYDWERTPAFLGFDVWSADREAFSPPDAVERIFDRLGLEAVNAFEREVRARDFDSDAYEIPRSAWYDGPAEGVVVRNKNGARAQLRDPAFRELDEPEPVEASAPALARRYATRRRFERLAAHLEDDGPVAFDAIYDRVLEEIAREAPELHEEGAVDGGAFRSEVAALTRAYLDERAGDGVS